MNVTFPTIQIGILKKEASPSVLEGMMSIAPDLYDLHPQFSVVQ